MKCPTTPRQESRSRFPPWRGWTIFLILHQLEAHSTVYVRSQYNAFQSVFEALSCLCNYIIPGDSARTEIFWILSGRQRLSRPTCKIDAPGVAVQSQRTVAVYL